MTDTDTRSAAAVVAYSEPDRIAVVKGHLAARMDGSDGRTTWLTSARWPSPNLHLVMLKAFVHTTGPGTRRLTSNTPSRMSWIFKDIQRFLGEVHGRDVRLEQVTAADIRAYRLQIPAGSGRPAKITELRSLTLAWFELGLAKRDLYEAASEYAGRTRPTPEVGLPPDLYSDVVAAASREVEAVIRRLEMGESLLHRFRSEPSSLSEEELHRGEALDQLATTGQLPTGLGLDSDGRDIRNQLPPMLFVTRRDLTPIFILFAARTGRNAETIKELTAEHHVREGLLLETETIKRRRGYESEVTTWEIGGPTRRLKTPGGLYLTLEALCRRARHLLEEKALLCVWSWADGGKLQYPWAQSLNVAELPNFPVWTKAHGFEEDGQPLRLTMNRIKTTVDRDRAKKTDFDLDRAAVTNTPAVLYSSYVAPDPTARRELQSITNGALLELDAALTASDSPEKADPISTRPPIGEDDSDAVATAFMHCRNLLGHPTEEGVECSATFLDCFGCPCAVVSDENIPTIMRLSEEMVDRFDRYPLDEWVRRFGQAWLAINNDILPSRSPEELAEFAADMPEATALALLEEPEMF